MNTRAFVGGVAARALAIAGLEMAQVAVVWVIYSATRDPLALGWIGLAQFLPVLVCAPVAGQVADRLPRRAIVVVTLLGLAAALAGLVVAGDALGPVLGLLLATGVLRAFLGPALGALLSSFIPRDAVGRFTAANTMAFTVAVIVGPAVGGVLLAAWSADVVYGASVAVIVVAAFLVVGFVAGEERGSGAPIALANALDGLRFLRSRPMLFAAVALDFVAVFLGGATALLPIYAVDVLHVGATGLGVLRAAPAVGAAVMGLWLTARPLERGLGRALFFSVGLFGAATIVFGLSTSLPLSLGMLAVLGAADMVSMVIRSGLMQVLVPSEWRGRVSAVTSVFIGASNELGELESGVAARFVGPVGAVVAGGLGTLAVVAVGGTGLGELRRLDTLPQAPTTERR
jgi:hypothetical protein